MFSRLRIYTVHVRYQDNNRLEKINFIQEGFSWMAFIFSTVWLLWHRLWLMAGFLFAANIGLALLIAQLQMDMFALTVFQFGLQLWIGFHGHDFVRSKLRRSGYTTVAIVSGENLMRAEQRFFDHHANMFAYA